MASLGQLTAGVAHEINNPINFVSAGIDSLKDNFTDITEVAEAYFALNPEEDNKHKLQKLHKLRKEGSRRTDRRIKTIVQKHKKRR
jgi:two-component system NtrC family sensor kinase